MKPQCEKCGAALGSSEEAWICNYECTFCGECSRAMAGRSPNCAGELVRRPRRQPAAGPAGA
jgi:hypothetical protein